MAFGISRTELIAWKEKVAKGEIAFLTHFWFDARFPDAKTVTKVGCNDVRRLIEWGNQYNLKKQWIDQHSDYPHFDLMGDTQINVLIAEKQWNQIRRFRLLD